MASSSSSSMPEPLTSVCISNALLLRICAEANRKYPYETGGILMGYYESTGQCTVTEIIGPGPRAKHCRTSFEPDYDFQEEQVAVAYGQSRRRDTYIGDWHTHPGGTGALKQSRSHNNEGNISLRKGPLIK